MTWTGILIIFVAINLMYQGEQQRPLMVTSVEEANGDEEIDKKKKSADSDVSKCSDKNEV